MKDKLVIVDREYVYRIEWFIAETGDEGATLGEVKYSQTQLAAEKDPETRVHILATITASKSKGVRHDTHGYYWDERKHVTQALREIKIALKGDKGVPWPDWAVKAAAEGWKAPKGWKPT